MKKHLLYTLTFAFICLGFHESGSNQQLQPINPIIGDVSFVETFGTQPNADADEQTRITTHLQYVQGLLKSKDVSRLPLHLQIRRAEIINHLQDYIAQGEFPVNQDYPGERQPCFIDAEGNICAVGYLVEKTAGIAMATRINNEYQYSKIYDMDSKELSSWIASSGLTLEECATIQPQYWRDLTQRPWWVVYEVFSLIPTPIAGSSVSWGTTSIIIEVINSRVSGKNDAATSTRLTPSA